MGQSSSSLRDQQPEDAPRVALPSPLDGNGPRRSLSTQEMPEEPVSNQTHRDEGSIRSRNSIFNLLSEPSTTTMPPPPALVNQSTSNASSSFSDDLRTLPVPVPQQRTRHHSAASRILSRRQSTMSRLGTRILPNSVIRGLLSSEEETAAEGQAHRNGRIIRPIPRTEILHNPSRFSPFNSLGSRGASRRRSIRGPYPLPRGDAALIPDSPPNQSDVDSAIDGAQGSDRGWRRSPRLNRVRQSLSTPISHIFGSPPDLPESTDARSPPSLRLPLSIELMNNFLPRSDPMDMHMDLDRPPTSDLEQQSMADMQPISSPPLPRPAPGSGTGPIRRLPGIIRARSPQLPRREEQTPLSRVLQVAAAAIAAQLSGNNTNTASNMQPLGDESFDASLESLFQSLQQVTSAQENHIGGPGPRDPSQPRGSSPLNFLRVFRFINGDGTAGRAENGEAEHSDLGGSDEDGIEGRTVTLVVVGVRSVPSNRPFGNPQDGGDIGLDTLLGLPHHPPTNSDNTFQDANFAQPTRPTDRISRLPSSFARPDMNPSTDTMNSGHHHHHRPTSGRLRESLDMMASPALSSVLVDSPPGPYPPPSTPAEVSTTLSSGNSSPSRRPSSASAMAPNFLPQVHEDPARESAQANFYAPTAGAGVRQRRRSDSEFARHRQFGAGSARRHGVVEPDQPSTPGGRTWVIYVVGTNLSENHPAFATPSLFTDNPTYEDMILLSSLLGPAKPPVASQADVSSSGGLFRLVEYAGSLVAEAYEGGQSIDIGETERCLICLSDYEAAEDIRQLTKCKHLYHKDCIDQWLTTGRNSCPLCRGQGVTESSSSANSMPAQQPSI